MVEKLEIAKEINGPKLLHIITKKGGKGVEGWQVLALYRLRVRYLKENLKFYSIDFYHHGTKKLMVLRRNKKIVNFGKCIF